MSFVAHTITCVAGGDVQQTETGLLTQKDDIKDIKDTWKALEHYTKINLITASDAFHCPNQIS